MCWGAWHWSPTFNATFPVMVTHQTWVGKSKPTFHPAACGWTIATLQR